MCLIAFALNPTPDWRLVLIANRDEFHARPAAPLAVWSDHPEVIAGRDIEANGTWLGINTRGRLAAVTNVRLPELPRAGLRSRGALALNYLAGTDSPLQYLGSSAGKLTEYGPCNLLLMDASQAIYASNQPGVPMQTLPSGIYGLSNATLDTPWPKTTTLKQALADWLSRDRADSTDLFTALSNPATPPDSALPDTGVGLARERFVAPAFIRGREYGTRCSTVILVAADGSGVVTERRFGPDGVGLGETRILFRWP